MTKPSPGLGCPFHKGGTSVLVALGWLAEQPLALPRLREEVLFNERYGIPY